MKRIAVVVGLALGALFTWLVIGLDRLIREIENPQPPR